MKNFVDEKPKLHIYNRRTEKIIERSAKNICYKQYLHETLWEDANSILGEYVLPNQIENDFSKIENKYSVLIKKIISICYETKNRNALICSSTELNGQKPYNYLTYVMEKMKGLGPFPEKGAMLELLPWSASLPADCHSKLKK